MLGGVCCTSPLPMYISCTKHTKPTQTLVTGESVRTHKHTHTKRMSSNYEREPSMCAAPSLPGSRRSPVADGALDRALHLPPHHSGPWNRLSWLGGGQQPIRHQPGPTLLCGYRMGGSIRLTSSLGLLEPKGVTEDFYSILMKRFKLHCCLDFRLPGPKQESRQTHCETQGTRDS